MRDFLLCISDAAPASGDMVRNLQLLADAGFRAAEIETSTARKLLEQPKEAWRAHRRTAEDLGIIFPDGHLMNGVDIATVDEAKRQEAIDLEKRTIELYIELGITAGAIHPGCWEMLFNGVPREKTLDALKRSFQELADFTRGTNFTVCLENCPDSVPNVETALAMIDSAERENLGFCLDTGHLNLSTPGAGAYVRACGKRLRLLHLHDNHGMHDRPKVEQGYWYEDDLHIPPYFFRNAVDWRDFIAALHEIDYQGVWNLELGLGKVPAPLRALKLRHIREWGEALFNTDWWKQAAQ